jgi:hypothetical protein
VTASTTDIQTHTLNDGPKTTTTYTRADLGIQTAVIASRGDGRWDARLYYGPEPDEHDSETVDREATADRLAVEHSLTF